MRFLVVIETQKVKSYLFASPFMRETRGASVLLDLLNRRKIKEILKTHYHSRHEEIYLGGGSGRVLFDVKDDADGFRRKVLELYRTETTNARVAVEIVERKKLQNELQDESFAAWVRRGVGQTQQEKYGRVEGVPLPAGRWIRPCTSCGVEPAEAVRREHGCPFHGKIPGEEKLRSRVWLEDCIVIFGYEMTAKIPMFAVEDYSQGFFAG
jgi:hypothetical protein